MSNALPEKISLDEELKRLAIASIRHPPLSKERQQTLANLVHTLLASGELEGCRKSKSQFDRDVYDEAVQELMLYICENIEKYDPKRGSFVEWAVMLMSKRFTHLVLSRASNPQLKQFPTESDLDNFLENIILPESSPSLMEEVKNYVELDPERLLRSQFLKNNKHLDFQILVRRRLLGDTWKEISEDTGIEISSLHSFYQRRLEKFKDNCRKYLAE